jgi:hypothetical protein
MFKFLREVVKASGYNRSVVGKALGTRVGTGNPVRTSGAVCF